VAKFGIFLTDVPLAMQPVCSHSILAACREVICEALGRVLWPAPPPGQAAEAVFIAEPHFPW